MTLNLAPAGPSPTTATSSGRLRGPPLLIADSERMADDRRSLIAPNAEYAPRIDVQVEGTSVRRTFFIARCPV
jgi:hypothetical protein